MKILFSPSVYRVVTAKPSAGGPISYSAVGDVTIGAPQVYKYLTYANYLTENVTRLILEAGVVINQNLTPEVCGVVLPNVINGLSSGEYCKVVCNEDGRLKHFDYLNATGSSNIGHTLSCAEGSLAHHIEAQTLPLITNLVAGDAKQDAWSSYSASPSGGFSSATRNANCFMPATPAIAVWKSGQWEDVAPPVLVTNRHAVSAAHTMPRVGDSVVYMRGDGTTQIVIVDAIYKFPSTDLGLMHFASAVTGITPYSLLPVAAFTKIHNSGSLFERLLAVVKSLHRADGTWRSQWGTGFIHSMYAVPSSRIHISVGSVAECHENAPKVQEFIASSGLGGDSGSPSFVRVNGQFVLVGVWSMAGGIHQSLVGVEAVVNPVLNSLASGVGDPAAGTYAVSLADISGFTTY